LYVSTLAYQLYCLTPHYKSLFSSVENPAAAFWLYKLDKDKLKLWYIRARSCITCACFSTSSELVEAMNSVKYDEQRLSSAGGRNESDP